MSYLDKNGIVDWPFAKKYITNILYDKGWDIEIHIPTIPPRVAGFFQGVTFDSRYNWTSIEDKRIKMVQKKILVNEEFGRSHFNKGKKYIKKLQSKNSKINSFVFIYYGCYHAAITYKVKSSSAIREQLKILDCWDFDEPDALFWIFQDHGNWKTFNYK